jgi:hypothetical protein
VFIRGLIFQKEFCRRAPGIQETKLQFEVNGQAFFVNFVPEEGRWYCYAPTEHGIQRIPVATDSAPFENFTFLDEPEKVKVMN